MNDVLDVAKYIINYCNKKNISITQLKLQKLLYFVQANFLLELREPCFNEEIIALPYGPVVKEVIEMYKEFGARELTVEDNDDLNLKEVEEIDSVLEWFAEYKPSKLIDITHNQAPWRDAYNKGIGTIITRESIISYFKRKQG